MRQFFGGNEEGLFNFFKHERMTEMREIKAENYIKPFTAKWWSNLWYYYKWHAVGVVVLIALLIAFLTQCVFRSETDYTLTYIGGLGGLGQIEAYQLEDGFKEIVDDIDENGEKKVKVNIIYLDDNVQSEEMGMMYQMADIEMAAGDTVAYLFSGKYLERYSKYGYVDLTEYVNEFGIDESLLKRYDDGSVYAICMSGNPIFTNLENADEDDLYLAVRPLRPNDKSDWQMKNYEQGIRMARYIISGGTVNP